MDDFWNDGFRMHYDEDEFYPDQLKVALADAVVMSIFFMRIGNALILDFRTAEGINPAIRVDGMAATPRDRLLSFRELRPELPDSAGRSRLLPGPSGCANSSARASCNACWIGATRSVESR
ncbi:MAG: hypothetical protein M9947_05880 [Thermomicrobiales bacterium]|nr:hypothetical protein [Thermomicrobiales bacterium]